MRLTKNEYNLIVYCLEQQMYEFNDDEQNDANNIITKLNKSNIFNSKNIIQVVAITNAVKNFNASNFKGRQL